MCVAMVEPESGSMSIRVAVMVQVAPLETDTHALCDGARKVLIALR